MSWLAVAEGVGRTMVPGMQRSKLDRVMYAVMDSQKVRRLVTLADGTTQR